MTLVLLHAAGATPAAWDPVREHLAGIPVLAPALPGREGAGPASSDIANHAAHVLRAMDRVGLARAAVAGHSLGGGVALHLALHAPDRVAGLGLVATGGRLRVRPEALAALPDGLDAAAEVMAATNFPPDASPELIARRRKDYEVVGGETLLADLTACDTFDVLDRLFEIRCRAQVLVGDADVLTPPKYARTMAERISAARLVVYPGAGHFLPWERPAEVAGELAVLWAATLGPAPVAPASGVREARSSEAAGRRRPPAAG